MEAQKEKQENSLLTTILFYLYLFIAFVFSVLVQQMLGVIIWVFSISKCLMFKMVSYTHIFSFF